MKQINTSGGVRYMPHWAFVVVQGCNVSVPNKIAINVTTLKFVFEF